MERFPVSAQLLLVQFRPCEHEAVLRPRELTCDELDLIDCINAYELLVVGMEVRPVVLLASFDEHPDHNAEETGDLWHASKDTSDYVTGGVAAPERLSSRGRRLTRALARRHLSGNRVPGQDA